MVGRGPSAVLTPQQLGRELELLIREFPKQAKLAMYTAGQRAKTEAVLALHATAAHETRKKGGKSRGKPLPAPIDQSELVRSGRVERMSDGASVEFIAPHASHVEHGTKPHKPPEAPIRAWAERKLRQTGKKKGTKKLKKKGPKRKGSSVKKPRTLSPASLAKSKAKREAAAKQKAEDKQKAIDALTEGTRWKIAKHGTDGAHFFARASQKFPDIVTEEVKKRIDKIK